MRGSYNDASGGSRRGSGGDLSWKLGTADVESVRDALGVPPLDWIGGDGVLGTSPSLNPITLAKLCGGAEIRLVEVLDPETEVEESDIRLEGKEGGGGPCA